MTVRAIPEYVEQLVEENTQRSLEEAVRLAPTHGLAHARLARRVLEQGVSKKNPRALAEADFYSRYAVKLSPENSEVLRIRDDVRLQVGSKPSQQ